MAVSCGAVLCVAWGMGIGSPGAARHWGIVGSEGRVRYPGHAAALADLCSADPEFP